MNDITITWKEKSYNLPARGPKGRMMAASKVEQVVTLSQLSNQMAEGKVPHVTLCIAYSKLLNHVGCPDTQEDVLEHLFADNDTLQDIFGEMLSTIMVVLTPTNVVKEAKEVPLDKPKTKAKIKVS